jgi:hypothetical protein
LKKEFINADLKELWKLWKPWKSFDFGLKRDIFLKIKVWKTLPKVWKPGKEFICESRSGPRVGAKRQEKNIIFWI